LRDLETGRATRPQRSTVDLLATALGLEGATRDAFVASSRGRPGQPTGPGTRLRPAPDLVGREAMVRDLGALVDVAGHVTLVGLAGVGKTVLALTVGHHAVDRFPGGVGGLVVTETSTEAEILASALSALRVRRVDELPARLAEGPALLVVDSADRSATHAVEACERLRRYTPALHVLATSRHPLGISDEHAWPVPPLEVPPPDVDLAEVLRYPAAALFVDRLRRVRQREVTAEQAGTLAALVRRLGGVPLALELAAARGRVLELDEMLARTADDASDGDPAGYQLRSAVLASWALLSPVERAALGRLATFQWRWSIELAEELLAGTDRSDADVVALVDRLVGLGLVSVRPDGAEMRFWLLDAVRDVAVEQAEQAGLLTADRDRHAAVMAGVAARTAAVLTGATGAAASAAERRLDGLVPDLYAALEHLRHRPSTSEDDDGPDVEYRRRQRADLEHCRALLRASSQRWHDVRGLPHEDVPE
jgi:predicted ATPase